MQLQIPERAHAEYSDSYVTDLQHETIFLGIAISSSNVLQHPEDGTDNYR